MCGELLAAGGNGAREVPRRLEPAVESRRAGRGARPVHKLLEAAVHVTVRIEEPLA